MEAQVGETQLLTSVVEEGSTSQGMHLLEDGKGMETNSPLNP